MEEAQQEDRKLKDLHEEHHEAELCWLTVSEEAAEVCGDPARCLCVC